MGRIKCLRRVRRCSKIVKRKLVRESFFEKTKKWAKKANYQNILTITYKNESGKPCCRRVSRGYRRNVISPIKGIDTISASLCPEVLILCRNVISPIKGIDTSLLINQHVPSVMCRNVISPIKGIDTIVLTYLSLNLFIVEM